LRKSRKKISTKLAFDIEQLKNSLTTFLDNEKLREVVVIPLKGRSQEADYMIVASGTSSRQVVSSSEKLIENLKSKFGIIPRAEGLAGAFWVLIDAGDIIIHIFRPEVREYYQLEKMWNIPSDISES
tara:strand:+ start:292 stop:672 length:381 start_codon:yes stop_codon:yes gene_type:complete